jgi:hypothetical protein
MRWLRVWALAPLFFACRPSNPVFPASIGHIRRVVILGNSILYSGPSAGLGWEHSWGMAASAKEKDFVHLLMKDIRSRDSSVNISIRNIADFELRYRAFDLSELDSMRGADLYIFKIAENVPDTATDFIAWYQRMIRYLDTGNAVKVVMDGFWKNPVNPKLGAYAESHHFPFIHLTDLSREQGMEAGGQYKNKGVSLHPSDQGMQAIESRIWDYIQVYFRRRDRLLEKKQTSFRQNSYFVTLCDVLPPYCSWESSFLTGTVTSY